MTSAIFSRFLVGFMGGSVSRIFGDTERRVTPPRSPTPNPPTPTDLALRGPDVQAVGAEGVVPQVEHVLPAAHHAVLHGVGHLQHGATLAGLVAHHQVLVSTGDRSTTPPPPSLGATSSEVCFVRGRTPFRSDSVFLETAAFGGSPLSRSFPFWSPIV